MNKKTKTYPIVGATAGAILGASLGGTPGIILAMILSFIGAKFGYVLSKNY